MDSIKLCECGCGQPVSTSNDRHQNRAPVRFIKGHVARVNHHVNLPGVTWGDLKELYIDKGLSAAEIADLKGCSSTSVLHRLDKLGIPRRSYKERQLNRYTNHPADHLLRRITKDGYVLIYMPSHPYARKSGWVAEHRLVVEKRVGRYLLWSEHVHHKGTQYPLGSLENRGDNRDENLFLATEHNHKMIEEACQTCGLRKEIRLLRLQVKELTKSLQFKLGDS